MLEYMFSHSFWGLCAWDLPALAVLVVMVLGFLLHCERMKEREDEMKEELEELQEETACLASDCQSESESQ